MEGRRRSVRLQGYDYAQAGAYFITVCTQNRQCLFGVLKDGEVILSVAGQMIFRWWTELNRRFPSVETAEFVVMPNHIHGIVVISVGADLCVGPGSNGGQCAHAGAPLARIVQWFKTMTTNEYIRGVKDKSLPPFSGRLWQRNYYEHVIRSEQSLSRIRQYVADNPARWDFDRENPSATKPEPNDVWLR